MTRALKSSATEKVVDVYRSLRQFGYRVVGPLDYLTRALTGQQQLPPIHLRRHVGPLRSFESSGVEFMTHLQQLCALRPDDSVLDVGCGCGQMALQLLHFLDARTGSYRGFDLHQPSINWCQRNIANRHSNFVFTYADIFSRAYNRGGQIAAAEYRFPFPSESFALVIAKSVFTHMLPAAFENYLNEIARALAPSGRALLTFFLLNDEQRSREAAGMNQLQFRFGDSPCRFVHASSPESAVAYDELFVLSVLQSHGLRLKAPIYYGSWSGNADGLSFQDLLLVESALQEK